MEAVWQNVAMGRLGHTSRHHAKQVPREVRLDHRSGAWPLILSGGLAQRIGRALVRKPELLLRRLGLETDGRAYADMIGASDERRVMLDRRRVACLQHRLACLSGAIVMSRWQA